jgi:hypothetical protein
MSEITVHNLPLPDRKGFASLRPKTRVSAKAPNLVRLIRRLRPTWLAPTERVSPTANVVSQAPRKRRGLSVVKCLCACLVVTGAVLTSRHSPCSSCSRRREPRARPYSVVDEPARTARGTRDALHPYRKFCNRERRRRNCAPRQLCHPDDQWSQCYIRSSVNECPWARG